jgi:spore coat protein I
VVRDGYDLEKRNREMKRVRAYIAKQHVKSKFEEVYLSVYERFYGQAQEGLKQLEELVKNTAVCQSIPDKSSAAYTVIPECFESHIGYCHGDYNNHNVLVTGKEKKVATIGFDKFYVGNQLADLYYFARKCVEKNGYNFDVLRKIITEYNSYINLSEADLAYIGILFAYPEKFYKLGNRYLNGSKVRISPVMLDKLKKIIESESKKQKILSKYCEIFLHI